MSENLQNGVALIIQLHYASCSLIDCILPFWEQISQLKIGIVVVILNHSIGYRNERQNKMNPESQWFDFRGSSCVPMESFGFGRTSCYRRMLVRLLGISHGTGLTDYRNFYLSRIGHFILYLRSNLGRKLLRFSVIHLICTNDYT